MRAACEIEETRKPLRFLAAKLPHPSMQREVVWPPWRRQRPNDQSNPQLAAQRPCLHSCLHLTKLTAAKLAQQVPNRYASERLQELQQRK